ncbi:unnamed protein product [Mesocestoides corti]|uniref:RING-type domain-containing protein n=1 Tax=Mesocestoides corti TaxID=53468 RepID=A0A0R3UQS1_MESCO|nr:unnamed protein product [Mesocestoides corti]
MQSIIFTILWSAFKSQIWISNHTESDNRTPVKIFQQQKCAVCSQALDPPSVHFLCDHSYHKSCFDTYSSEDQLCPECAPLIRRDLVDAHDTSLAGAWFFCDSCLLLIANS